MSELLDRPTYRGRSNVDYLTWAAFLHAEKKARGPRLEITQGSYNFSEEDSAGTHDGGGALDISTRGMNEWRKRRVVKKLRKAGFAAWLRRTWQGPWPEHIHAILVDHPALSPSAAQQVAAYRDGRNGLANNGPDTGPRLRTIPTWEDYMIIITEQKDFDRLAKSLWRYKIPRTGKRAQQLMRQIARKVGVNV